MVGFGNHGHQCQGPSIVLAGQNQSAAEPLAWREQNLFVLGQVAIGVHVCARVCVCMRVCGGGGWVLM